MDTLTETLRNTCLNDEPEQLLFRPQAGSGLAENALDSIPRYLFRVVTPHSDGKTNGTWARSEAARRNRYSSLEDIFFHLDYEKRTTIAHTLNLHLRWWPKGGFDDNFVSWTSSLLFAVQYIYYRHLSAEYRSSLEDIQLYVVDTTLFPRGTFICDLDLIECFYQFDDNPTKDLGDLRSLRNGGIYYFGEYLSQGSLKIEGKHQMIPAKSLFDDNRLCRLQPQFPQIHTLLSTNMEVRWSNEVVRLRRAIWSENILGLPSVVNTGNPWPAIEEIIANVAPGWRLPIAIYFAALVGPESEEQDEEAENGFLFLLFQDKYFDEERKRFNPSSFKVIAPETMPELKQVKELVCQVYKHSQLTQALRLVKAAHLKLRRLQRELGLLYDGGVFTVADSNGVLARDGQTLLSRLRMIRRLCEDVAFAISPNGA